MEYKHKYNIPTLVLIIVVLITGTMVFLRTEEKYSIKTTLNKLDKIDNKYNTQWKKETIPKNLVGNSIVDNAVKELQNVQEKIKEQKSNETVGLINLKDLLINLTDARIAMLEAQKQYNNAETIGPKGRISYHYQPGKIGPLVDEKINCADVPELEKFNEIAQKSWEKAIEAFKKMDLVLQNSEEAKDLIGVGEKKPEFYNSPLGEITLQIKINKAAIELCKTSGKVYKELQNTIE